MAKARSRTAARKVKDRWKAKSWYTIQAPPAFDSVTVADTLSDVPESLINRVTSVSFQDISNDFRKSHIKLYFKIHKVEDEVAHTQFAGHTLTSDYLRRMIRRRRSKIDGVYDVTTRDGAVLRVKPFATTDKRIQNSQKRVVREAMKKTITDQAKTSTLTELVKQIIDGKTGSDIYKNCKKLYPVKRVEIYKTEVLAQPSIMIADKKPAKKKEKEEPTTAEEPEKEEKKKPTKKPKEETPKESEEVSKEKESEESTEKPKKNTPAKKKTTTKKTAAKKTTPKQTTKKSAKTTTAKKKAPAKKVTKKAKK
ncbi:MAG: 30S ribosomal protein S3ae [Candidatus Thermoplasmatota archaeon]|nr:30S ribosomal protein S3ae [Candidatus Thermoplasmatota archaeon]